MRRTLAGKIAFLVFVAGTAGLIMPNPSLGTYLSLVSGASREVRLFDPPALPFTWNNDETDVSLNNALGFILNEGFGVTTESFLGPGVTSWEGKNGAEFFDNAIIAGASAVGTVAALFNPAIMGDAQYVKDIWFYAAIYELRGNPGGSANISLDYELKYNYFNIAIGGSAKSEVAADFHPWIIPADKTWKYGDDASNNYFYGSGPWPGADAKHSGETFTYENDEEYILMDGFEDINRVKSGSLNLGSMNVGDRLYLWGALGALATSELYLPSGLLTATSFTTFEGYFTVDDTSPPTPAVPEPASLLLLGAGLSVIGLAAWRRAAPTD